MFNSDNWVLLLVNILNLTVLVESMSKTNDRDTSFYYIECFPIWINEVNK